MPEHKQVMVRENPPVSTGGDWLKIAVGVLGAIKLILAAPPFEIEIPNATMEAWTNFISWGFVAYGLYKNTYLTPKGKKQKDVLQQVGLKSPDKGK